MPRPRPEPRYRVAVIGAGIAGLAAALRLAVAGCAVTLFDRHPWVGGKIRAIDSPAGPIDAGPTVLTLRRVFDELFAAAGTRLEDHVDLVPQDVLARHFWPDGSTLDLHANPEISAEAIRSFAGARAAAQFQAFNARTARLFDAFDGPMMQTPNPRILKLAGRVARDPGLLSALAPFQTLRQKLVRDFDDPRLAQLFGRYATYVGGLPTIAPALLSLIWQAEARGVWVVAGGMHRLAAAMRSLLETAGAEIHTDCHVDRIELQGGLVTALHADARRHPIDAAVYAGDPRALASGAFGPDFKDIARRTIHMPRSLSARVLSFAATPHGPELAHHNVFFDGDPVAEFDALARNEIPAAATLYLCALDRGQGRAHPALERFELIANAPATHELTDPEDLPEWTARTLKTLGRFKTTFSPAPGPQNVTTPQKFAQMFPASLGALYGQTPHGMTAGLARPRAQTRIPNLMLAGGGAHPGAGVPMAALSARHAAEAILNARTSTSTSARTVMRGGMSTA